MAGLATVTEVAIAFPFSINSQGKVEVAVTQEKIWQDRVLAVIGTGFRERAYRPEFGSDLYSLDFSNFLDTEHVVAQVKHAISDAFSKYLPSLTLVAVNFSQDSDNSVTTVDIQYRLPNQTLVNTSLSTLSLNGNLPPTGS
jgi:phage baseplate assembly protein W